MKRLYQILFALAGIFIFTQCVDNQSNKEQTGKPDTTFVPGDTGHLPEMKIGATPGWFCSSIENYPVDSKGVQRAVGGKNKFWATGSVLRIGFLGGTAAQIAAVKQYAPEWTQSANLTFTFPATGPYDCRIAFSSAGGAWSYVGTDCKLVTSQTQPTMNLGWIGRDVICHEFGHFLGLFHEHQNPDGGICWNEANVIASLSGPPNNWSVAQIRFNVLDKLNPGDVLTSAWDKVSVMHYNIPANWTCNNTAISGGLIISQADKDFIRARYPGNVPPTTSVTLTSSQIDDIVAMLSARQTEADTTAARTRRTVATIKTILKR